MAQSIPCDRRLNERPNSYGPFSQKLSLKIRNSCILSLLEMWTTPRNGSTGDDLLPLNLMIGHDCNKFFCNVVQYIIIIIVLYNTESTVSLLSSLDNASFLNAYLTVSRCLGESHQVFERCDDGTFHKYYRCATLNFPPLQHWPTEAIAFSCTP